MDQNVSNTPLMVTVKTPESVLFEGEAEAITSLNEKGVFDILPLHENFITIINQTLTIHEKNKTKKDFTVESGIVKVTQNNVRIYVGLEKVEVAQNTSNQDNTPQKTTT